MLHDWEKMSLQNVLFVSFVVFALISWWAIPTIKRRMMIDRSEESLAKAAMLSFLGVARMAALIFACTTASILAVVWFFGSANPISLDAVATAVDSTQSLRERLAWFSTFWGAFAISVIGLGMAIHSWRRGQLRFVKAFERKREVEFTRLQKDFEEGNWEELPPTSTMSEIDGELEKMELFANEFSESHTAEETEQVVAQLQSRADELVQIRFSVDLHRRIDDRLDPEAVDLPAPRNMWERVQRFFFSEGLVASLGGVSRVVYFALFALLIPSLIGVYSGAVTDKLDQRVVQLKDLRFDLTIQQSKKDWDEAREGLLKESNGSSDVEGLTEEEDAAIDQIAAEAEVRFAKTLVKNTFSWPTPSTQNLRQLSVRQRLVENAARAAKTNLEISPALKNTAGLSKIEMEAVSIVENAGGKPRTKFGKTVASEMRDLSSRSPSVRQNVKKWAASFQRPARADTMAKAMTQHAAGLVLDSGGGELGRVVEQAIDGTDVRKTANQLSKVRSRQFLQDVASGKPLNASMEGLSRPVPFTSNKVTAELSALTQNLSDVARPNKILEKVKEFPPGMDSLPEKHVNLKRAGQRIDTSVHRMFPETGTRLQGQRYANSVTQYRDHFPSFKNAEQGTIRGQLLEGFKTDKQLTKTLDSFKSANSFIPPTISGSGGGGGSIGSPSVRKPFKASSSVASTRSFSRARSFRGLRGFSKVGGVLIGNEPTDADAQLNLKDIQWEIDGENLTLILTDADGKKHKSKSVRASIAHQALAYAADGRPLAVTMVTAEPLSELQILLHPALIDTPLGARIIQLDRLVDKYTGGSEGTPGFRDRAQETVANANRLYAISSQLRLIADRDGFNEFKSRIDPEDVFEIERRMDRAAELETNPRVVELIAEALKSANAIADEKLTPLVAKPEFYDAVLVKKIIKVAGDSSSATEFIKKFKIEYGDSLTLKMIKLGNGSFRGVGVDRPAENLFGWLNKPSPDSEDWSGVRERPFDLSIESILPTNGSTKDPLSFMLQVAFTSPPYFLGSEKEIEEYLDESPWEYPSIRRKIQKTVLDRASSRDKKIILDSAEFVLLQRFFRMALDGKLGDFPIEKLELLQEACIAAAPPKRWRTQRWNSREGQLQQVLMLQILQSELEPDAKKKLLALLRDYGGIIDKRTVEVKELAATLEEGEMPSEIWQNKWDAIWAKYDQEIVTWEQELEDDVDMADEATLLFKDAIGIRRNLGVHIDDAQGVRDAFLPMPSL